MGEVHVHVHAHAHAHDQEKIIIKPLYDIIIFGASGFTGKYVVREALKFLKAPSSPLRSLALAGRSPVKVAEALAWAAWPHPPPDVDILVADTTDSKSLRRLCARTKLILNCVGPFRLHGEPVVAACVEAGCDCLDICGEPEFMERMEAKYHERAAMTGSLVISACGFDSVPAELGLIFHSRQWTEPSVPNSVEAYLEPENCMVANYATFESAILGVANMEKLMELRKSRPRRARPVIPGPAPKQGEYVIEHQTNTNLWVLKLPSADSIVVRKTLAALTENPDGLPGTNESPEQVQERKSFWSSVKPAHFGVKIGSKTRFGIYRFMAVGMLIGHLTGTRLGRWLLLTFPYLSSLGCFRKSGPSEDEVSSGSFKMWFVGQGYSSKDLASSANPEPDMEIVTRIAGPEMGYLTTSIILVQCALILLSQRQNLPKGGTLPPGIVFGPTDLQERLQKNGISFDVISKTYL